MPSPDPSEHYCPGTCAPDNAYSKHVSHHATPPACVPAMDLPATLLHVDLHMLSIQLKGHDGDGHLRSGPHLHEVTARGMMQQATCRVTHRQTAHNIPRGMEATSYCHITWQKECCIAWHDRLKWEEPRADRREAINYTMSYAAYVQ
jgi:hypothetical protein